MKKATGAPAAMHPLDAEMVRRGAALPPEVGPIRKKPPIAPAA